MPTGRVTARANQGGKSGGGATLTETGRLVLDRYRALELRAERLLAPDIAEFDDVLPG